MSSTLRDDGQVEHLPADFSWMAEVGSELNLDRRRFEQELDDYLAAFPRLLNELIEHAVSERSVENGGDVDLVILTGGHSQWYFVKEALVGTNSPLNKIQEEPYRVVRGPHPQETVARGLAMAGTLGLGKVRRSLDKHGESFVSACESAAKQIMETDSNWQNNLGKCVSFALATYAKDVQREVQVEINKVNRGFTVPTFTVGKPNAQIEVGKRTEVTGPDVEDYTTLPGLVAGAAVGTAILPGIGTGIGALLGALAGTAGGEKLGSALETRTQVPDEQESLKNVRETARKLLPVLKAEAESYLDRLESAAR